LDADEEGADEARTAGDRDAVDAADVDDAGPGERFADDIFGVPKVVAGGELGDDAAVGGVDRNLAVDDVGEDVPLVVDDGGSGFVAGGFEG
jgi:hypothetical protein